MIYVILLVVLTHTLYLLRLIRIQSVMLREFTLLRRLGDVGYIQRVVYGYDWSPIDYTWLARQRWIWLTRWNWLTGNCKYEADKDRLTFYPD